MNDQKITSDTLDLLLQPISKAAPCGVDLRNDTSMSSSYFELKDYRLEALSLETKQQHEEITSKHSIASIWSTIYNKSLTLLSTQSKDLEILSWFIESSIRKNHLEGFCNACDITRSIIKQFHHDIHPHSTLSLDKKMMSLVSLNGDSQEGSLPSYIRCISLSDHNEKPCYSVWHYQCAAATDSLSDKKKSLTRSNELGFCLQDINNHIKEADPSIIKHNYDSGKKAIQQWLALADTIESIIPDYSFPCSYITKAISSYCEALSYLAPAMIRPKQITSLSSHKHNDSPEIPTEYQTKSAEAKESQSPLNNYTNRSQAISDIHLIANYFIEHEPHSPIPYMLERAALWADMKYPELLNILISENKTKTDINQLTGIEL